MVCAPFGHSFLGGAVTSHLMRRKVASARLPRLAARQRIPFAEDALMSKVLVAWYSHTGSDEVMRPAVLSSQAA